MPSGGEWGILGKTGTGTGRSRGEEWMMIRMIALDVDGTLLTSKGRLTEGTVRAIGAVRAKGVRVESLARIRSMSEDRGIEFEDQEPPLRARGFGG